MLKFEDVNTYNIRNAIRGMRNSFNSWEKSDSYGYSHFNLGENDLKLAKKLVAAGSSHRKFLRQIFVSVNITAPLYFWKQLDTYKIGTTRNSTSTMHTVMKQPFTKNMFSFDYEYMPIAGNEKKEYLFEDIISDVLKIYNLLREKYLETKDKRYWKALIQVLPSSFNQMSTMTFNYEVLRNIYFDRRTHRLEEWEEFCSWIEGLPHAELITHEGEENGEK